MKTSDDETAPISVGGSLQTLATLLAPGTLIAALMYYFGWVRTHSFYAFFGIDADELDLSTTDYVVRSADALWPSLGALVVIVLLFLLAHGLVGRWIERVEPVARSPRLLVLPLCAFGVTLSSVGALRFVGAQQASIATPLCLAVGFGFAAYAWLIHRRLTARRGLNSSSGLYSQRMNFAVSGLFILLIVLNVFWGTALFAEGLGRGRAQRLESQSFATTPDVLLYTSHRLHVDARDVTEVDLGGSYAPYRFPYEGLKLLIRSNGRVILIPLQLVHEQRLRARSSGERRDPDRLRPELLS